MRLPQLLKNPAVMLHALAWVAIAVYYGIELAGFYPGVTLGLLLYLFIGVTAIAALPVCWLSLRRGIRAHDRGLIAQSSVGALAACWVLGYAAFLLTLIRSNPR